MKGDSLTGIITITTNDSQDCCYIAAKVSEALTTLGKIPDVVALSKK